MTQEVKNLTDEQYQAFRDNFKTVVDNNKFGEREIILMQFGAMAAIEAIAGYCPAGLTICSLSGRPFVEPHPSKPEPYSQPGNYRIFSDRSYGEEDFEVEEGYDARDALLEHLGYHISKHPVEPMENEDAA